MAILPPGPYLLEAIEVSHLHESHAGNPIYNIQFRLLGTSYDELFAYYVDSPGAKWVWENMVERFSELPTIVGRVFLIEVKVEDYVNGAKRNRLMTPLAEVV